MLIIYSEIHEKHFLPLFAGWSELFNDFSKHKVNFFYCDMSLISVIQFIIHKRVFVCLFFLPIHEQTAKGKSFIVNGILFFFWDFLRFLQRKTRWRVEKACDFLHCNTFTDRQCDGNWMGVEKSSEKNPNKPCALNPWSFLYKKSPPTGHFSPWVLQLSRSLFLAVKWMKIFNPYPIGFHAWLFIAFCFFFDDDTAGTGSVRVRCKWYLSNP